MPLWLLLAAAVSADSGRSFPVVVAPGESLHVAVFGRGEPIVIIPGFFGSVFGFRKLVPLLEAAGYQPTVVEPLGTGFSGRPARADYSFIAQADRIAAALDSLGIRRRLAPLLENDRNQFELFTALLFSMPGSPVLYYEIGRAHV